MSRVLALSLFLAACGAAQRGAPPLAIEGHTAAAAGFVVSSWLITGPHDAILVDAQFTRSEATRLVERIRASGKRLTAIVITHGHPDHYLGLEVVTRAFPGARVLARPAVIADLQATAQGKIDYWKAQYHDDLADAAVIPAPLVGDALDLDGAAIRIVDLDGGESAHASALYVPSLRALITGDAVYHDVHLWLAENRPEAWLAQLDRLAAIGPIERVYPGHGAPGGAELLDANRAYLRAFLGAPADAKQAAQALVAQFPSWQLPIIAELSTAARK